MKTRKTDLLSNDTQARIDNLPIFMRYIANILTECIDDVINGDCNEDDLLSTVNIIKNNAEDRYGKDDLLNYDKAGEILGFGATNRVALKQLLDSYGIHQVVINNMKCGFKRSEIMALRDKIYTDVEVRNIKQKHKAALKKKRNGKNT